MLGPIHLTSIAALSEGTHMKTWLAMGAGALTLALVASVLGVSVPRGNTAAVAVEPRKHAATFDKHNVAVRFAVLSDTHQTGRMDSYAGEQFREALEMLRGMKLDAVTIAGDVTDLGTKQEIRQFKQLYEQFMGNTPLFYSLGNHDGGYDAKPDIPNQGNSAQIYKSALGPRYFRHDQEPSMISTGNRWVKMRGYNFVAVEPEGYYGEDRERSVYFSDETLDWFSKTLATIAKEEPLKPIFVYTHAAPYDTVYGSTLPSWQGMYGTYLGNYTKDLTPILEKYSQVVTLSGHTHFPTNDERSIMQTKFTSLNAGAVYYGSNESGFAPLQDYQWASDLSTFSQGLIVEVDRSDNMRVTRLDFFNNDRIKQPWIVGAPRADGAHLKTYRAANRKARNAAPSLRQSTMMVWRNPADEPGKWSAGLKFTAGTDDDQIHHYRVNLTKGGETVRSWKVSSEYFMEPRTEKMRSNFMLYDIGLLDSGAKYAVRLVAVDVWGAESRPKVFTFKTAGTSQRLESHSEEFLPGLVPAEGPQQG